MNKHGGHAEGFNLKREARYWYGIAQLVFTRADTLTIRLMLANASFLWAVGVMFEPDVFSRHGYEIARLIPRWVWIVAFLGHFAGVYWRVFDPKERVKWGIAVNALGLAVWLLLTVLINMAVGGFAPGTSLEIVFCFASAWALYRTGLKSELKLITD